MKCSKCGFECKETDKFCKSCGNKLVLEEKIYCPYCGEICSTETILCPTCNALLKNVVVKQVIKPDEPEKYDGNFTKECKYCLKKIPEKAQKCPHCGEWQNKSYGCLSVFSFICLLLAIFALMFAQTGYDARICLTVFLCVFIYCIPSIVADSRGHDSADAIMALNFFFGWTIIGWFVVLIWALATRKK